MPASTLIMVMLAAVFHATWNLAAKAKRGEAYVFVWWYALLTGVVMVPLGAVEVIRSGGFDHYGAALWWAPAISAALHMGYNLTLQTGYERAPLGTVYPPARGTGPGITMLGAIRLLGERPGWLAGGGALLIVAGIVVAAAPTTRLTLPAAGHDVAHHGRQARRRLLAGLGWGSATGLFIAGYTLWDDHSVTALGQLPISYFAMSSVYQAILMTCGMNRDRWAQAGTTLRRNVWPIAAITVLSPAAYVLVLIAMQTQPVSLVAPLRETSIVIGTLLAWLVFKESAPVQRLLGALVVVGGVALIGL